MKGCFLQTYKARTATAYRTCDDDPRRLSPLTALNEAWDLSLISENWQSELIPHVVLSVRKPQKVQALHISASILNLIGSTWHFIKILVLLQFSAVRRFMRYYKTEAHTYNLKLSRPNPSHEYGFSSFFSPSPTKQSGITKLMSLMH